MFTTFHKPAGKHWEMELLHAARPRVAQMGVGPPKPQGVLSVHGQGQVEEIESD